MAHRLPYLVLAAAVVFLDQWTKWMAARSLWLHRSVEIVSGLFSLTLVHNDGMAFGLFSGEHSAYKAIFLSTMSAAALVLIVYYATRIPLSQRWLHTGLALIFGGALGNLIDRFRLGYVIDYLDFHWKGYSWPAFNVADSCISIGMGLLIADFLLGLRRKGE